MSDDTLNRRALLSAMTLSATAIASLGATGAAIAQQSPTPPPTDAGIKVTDALARFIAGGGKAVIPEPTRELARLHILDTLAALVACRDLEPARLARSFALSQTGGVKRNAATILGSHDKAALTDAVFASAMTAHAAEINDFIPSAFVQPGPSIVSTALALAETRAKSGDDILRAVVTGYELAGRIPKALGNDNLRKAGIANHGVGPVFGTAAAAATMLDLPENRIADLLTYCAQQASGSWQWLLDVEHIEKAFTFAGMGARNGLQAALMVAAGFRGVRDSLDNPDGWMRSGAFHSGDADVASLIEGLGVRSQLRETGYKRYPVGGPAQPSVDGLLKLLPQIDRNAVAGVAIAMPGRWQAFRDAAMPALNLRYLCAIILIDGRLDFTSAQSLERMASDARVRTLMDRVTVTHDPAQEPAPDEERAESSRLTVTETSGKRHEVFTPFVVGYPTHPMSRAEVEAKAMELMAPRLGAARAREVVKTVASIDTLKSGGSLAALIAS